ncbi:N-acetyltransferase family protein [Wielerella bovis]|nr:GNAT family N-acetyltransferase [Wielerella bovis]ULJ63633.1 N-acetyltransferase family protein [Wielerella bovis]
MMWTMSVARREELAEIVAIYNSTIASRQVTADLHPVSVAQRETWFDAHQSEQRPLYAVHDKVSRCLVAWGSFSDYYPRAAYQRTAEISIYVHENWRGKGLGEWILREMMQRAPTLGIHKIAAVIFAHNVASIALFRKLGYEQWGVLPEVCELDGKLADVIILGVSV